MKLTIRLLPETDGRWIGIVPELPGATVYGATADDATVRAKVRHCVSLPKRLNTVR